MRLERTAGVRPQNCWLLFPAGEPWPLLSRYKLISESAIFFPHNVKLVIILELLLTKYSEI